MSLRGIRWTEPVQPQSATFTVKIPSYDTKIKYIREVWLATDYLDHPLWAQYSAPPLKVSNYTEVLKNITNKCVNNAWKELNVKFL